MSEARTISLPKEDWQARREAHRQRVEPWVAARLQRTRRQQKHPVYDFLFEYYFFKPAHLLRWSPGVGVRLEQATEDDLDWKADFQPTDGGRVLSPHTFPAHRREFLRWMIDYLLATGEREPHYACFGLHEWAMVYQEPKVRHARTPLRLSRAETDAVVEASALRCTHYDAFRFYTEAARPLNRHQLCRSGTKDYDQPGCVHVCMDLYKWAFMIAPYSPAELVADAFELAVAAREFDMRASPYDLRDQGFEPIPIETRAGREVYIAGQQQLAARSHPIRAKILACYQRLLAGVQQNSPGVD